MDFKDIEKLVALLEQSKLGKIALKRGDFEISLEKDALPRAVRTVVEAPQGATAVLPAPAKVEAPSGNFVTSPMVGTYYASAAPDQPRFVKVGDKVNENTVVCIVEAMKVMNEVKAGQSGTVAEILVDNARPVEFGTRLLRIV